MLTNFDEEHDLVIISMTIEELKRLSENKDLIDWIYNDLKATVEVWKSHSQP